MTGEKINQTVITQSASKGVYFFYQCSGCGHKTVIDKFYKTRRVFCGVCGEKSRMDYQGECDVTKRPTPSDFALRPKNH